MPRLTSSLFAQADLDRITAAINEAESKTSGKPADELIEVIQQCGLLLQKHGFARRRNDPDEISSRLRMGEKVLDWRCHVF
ncbi:hypothetical protein L0337_44955 [candidate division KSB1 bacterium]|nr:hypothetical protein [candidate division KSB1 bacterium]